MNHKNQMLALALAGALLAAVLLTGCGGKKDAASSVSSASASSETTVSESAAMVQVLFTVNYADGSSETLTLETSDGGTLAQALADAGLISQEEADAGFVTTVGGVTADWDKDHAWWCLTDAQGEATTVGVGGIQLHEGDSYAFTYTK